MQAIFCALAGAASAVTSAEDLRAIEVLHKAVETRDGKVLGTVEDLVVDLDRGVVRAVVVAEGDKLHAHSIAALSQPPASGKLVLEHAHGAVHRAPGFERERWPRFSDPYWLNAGKARLARASELIGGAIDDVVFDPASGRAQAILQSQHDDSERRVPLAELK